MNEGDDGVQYTTRYCTVQAENVQCSYEGVVLVALATVAALATREDDAVVVLELESPVKTLVHDLLVDDAVDQHQLRVRSPILPTTKHPHNHAYIERISTKNIR